MSRIHEHRHEDDIDFDDDDVDVGHIDEEDENLKPLSSQQQQQPLPEQPKQQVHHHHERQNNSGGDDESSSSSSSSSSEEDEDSESDQNAFLEVKWGVEEEDEDINNRKLWQAFRRMEEATDEKERPLLELALLAGEEKEEEKEPDFPNNAPADKGRVPLHELALLAGEEKEEEKEPDFTNNTTAEKIRGPLHELALLAGEGKEPDFVSNNTPTTKGRDPLHELALLAGEEKEAPIYTDYNNMPVDSNKGPLHELALLAGEEKKAPYDDTFDEEEPSPTAPMAEVAEQPENKKRSITNPFFPSPAKRQKLDQNEPHNASTIKNKNSQSDFRQKWNTVLQERSKSKQMLEDAKIELERAQANLEVVRQKNEQAEQAVPKLLSDIYLHLIQEDPPWYDFFKKLQSMKETNTSSGDSHTTQLGRWVTTQRRLYREHQLDLPKIHALEHIGLDWDPVETKWKKNYALLQDYVQKNGHAKVPYWYDKDGLAAWVKRQQYQYKLYNEQRPSEMNPQRIKLLDDIGMVWNRRSKSWMERYEHLKAFQREYGHVNVPAKFNPSLHEWVSDQRTQLKKYKRQEGGRDDDGTAVSTLSKEQVDLLQDIGLEIDLRDSRWQTKLEELIEFNQIHGHCYVPKKYPKNQALANWCGTQRRQYKLFQQQQQQQPASQQSSCLSNHRIAKLLEVGFEFDPSTAQRSRKQLKTTWEEQFSSLNAFYETKGHLNVPQDSSLGKWWEQQKQQVNNFIMASAGGGNDQEGQQQQRRQPISVTKTIAAPNNCQLSENQVNRLKGLLDLVKTGGCPMKNGDPCFRNNSNNTASKTWEDYFEELLAHRIYSNSYQIPSSRVDLQNWVDEQRQEYLKFHAGQPSKLTRSRVTQLRAVKFPFNAKGKRLRGVLAPTWEEMFLQLLQFRVQFNTFQVPLAGEGSAGDLFRWVKDQQVMFAQQQAKMKQAGDNNNKDTASDITCRKRISKLRNVGFPFLEASTSDRSPPLLARPQRTKGGAKAKSSSTRPTCGYGDVTANPLPQVIMTTPQQQQQQQQQEQQQHPPIATTLNNDNNSNVGASIQAEEVPEFLFYYPFSPPVEAAATGAAPRAVPPFPYFPQHPSLPNPPTHNLPTATITLGNSPYKNSQEEQQ